MFNMLKHSQMGAPDVAEEIGDASNDVRSGYDDPSSQTNPIKTDDVTEQASNPLQEDVLRQLSGAAVFSHLETLRTTHPELEADIDATLVRLRGTPDGRAIEQAFSQNGIAALQQQAIEMGIEGPRRS